MFAPRSNTSARLEKEHDLGAELLAQVRGDLAAVDGLEELGRAQRGPYHPLQPRWRVCRELVHRPGRDVEGPAGPVAALLVFDDRADRALEDLEVLVLAGVVVPGRELPGPAVARLHLQELRLDRKEPEDVAVLAVEL